MFDRQDPDELRRRGLELQAALPEPSPRVREHLRRRENRSQTEEAAEGVAWFGPELGLWGVLLVVPYLIIRLLRRLQRFTDPPAGD
jgi:hypothetical protein